MASDDNSRAETPLPDSVSQGGAGPAGQRNLRDEWFSCRSVSDCALREVGCCQTCGPRDLAEAIAVNTGHIGHLNDVVCEVQTEQCDIYDCPSSGKVNVMGKEAPQYILAVCRSGKCQAVDLREDELSACTSNQDCRLRWGTGCCQECWSDSDDLVAISRAGKYDAEVCGPEFRCPCASRRFLKNANAVCNSSGHCGVSFE